MTGTELRDILENRSTTFFWTKLAQALKDQDGIEMLIVVEELVKESIRQAPAEHITATEVLARQHPHIDKVIAAELDLAVGDCVETTLQVLKENSDE